MKPGDIIEWRGANRHHQGQVTESDEGILVVRMDDGHSFPLSVLLRAKIRVIRSG